MYLVYCHCKSERGVTLHDEIFLKRSLVDLALAMKFMYALRLSLCTQNDQIVEIL